VMQISILGWDFVHGIDYRQVRRAIIESGP
jgi:hypothetical protein